MDHQDGKHQFLRDWAWLLLLLGNTIACGQKITPTTRANCTRGTKSELVRYEPKIALLMDKCTSCHGASSARGGIRLDSYELLKSNSEGAWRTMITGSMPPTGKLPDEDLCDFQDWMDNQFRR